MIKPSSWTKPVVQIAAAGLGAAIAGPLGGAIGGWLGDALGRSATKLVKEAGEKFGEKAGEKLLDTGSDFLLDQLAETPANLESLYRDSLRLSFNRIRALSDPDLYETADWFLHWNTCLMAGVSLDLPALQPGELLPANLDHLFRLTLERLDAQGDAIGQGKVSLNIRTRTMPLSLVTVLNVQLPALLKETFAALIVTPKYEQAWKQTSLKFENVTVAMLKGLKEDNRQLLTGLAEANAKLDALGPSELPTAPLDPFATVPPRPPNFISRPEITEPLIEHLLSSSETTAITAVEGMGGIGKTIVANEVCHDKRIRKAFPDGILWFTLGKQPGLTSEDLTRQMAQTLNLELKVYSPAAYRSLFIAKSVLVVLDDVWSLDSIQPFLIDSENSHLIYTTRVRDIAASLGATNHDIGLLNDADARSFLARWSGSPSQRLPEPQATQIVAECRGLVLGLAMIGAALKNKPAADWARVVRNLKSVRLQETGWRLVGYAYRTLYSSILASIEELSPEDKFRYLKLAVLLEDMPASDIILQQIWGGAMDEVQALMGRLVDNSLANFDTNGSIRLHDFQLDFIRGEYARPASLAVVHSALLRSLHVIRPHPEQLASQLIGRLLSHRGDVDVAIFLNDLDAHTSRPYLCPLWPTLEQAGAPTLRLFKGYSGGPLSTDGKRVVFSSYDHTLQVCNLEGNATPRILEGHTGAVVTVKISPGGKIAVSGSSDSTLHVWDLESNAPPRILQGHTGTVMVVAISPDGRRAVSASGDRTLRVWDLETSAAQRIFQAHRSSAKAVAISTDGKRAVTAYGDHTLRVWDLEGNAPPRILQGHTNNVMTVAISTDGRRAVSGSSDETLLVWDLEGNAPPRILEGHTEAVGVMAISADIRRAVSASGNGTLRVWDLEGNTPPRVLEGPTDLVRAVAISPDGRRAVSGSDDQIVRVWGLEDNASPRILQGHTAAVMAVMISPDGSRAVSASIDHTLRVWDLQRNAPPRILEGHAGAVNAVLISKDGRRTVSASSDQTLRVWDLESNAPPRVLEGHTAAVEVVAISPDGRQAVSAGRDGTLRVWDLEGNAPPGILEGHTGAVKAVMISPDGRRAVSAGLDGTLRVWDLEGNAPPRILEGHTAAVMAVMISPDGRRAVSAGGDGTLRVWDLEGNAPSRILEGRTGAVHRVAFSPDGRRAVSSSSDQTLRVWDLEGNAPPRILEGHTSVVEALAISPDGKCAIFSSYDGTLRVLGVEGGRCLTAFTCDVPALSCCWVGEKIVVGDWEGGVHLLRWET